MAGVYQHAGLFVTCLIAVDVMSVSQPAPPRWGDAGWTAPRVNQLVIKLEGGPSRVCKIWRGFCSEWAEQTSMHRGRTMAKCKLAFIAFDSAKDKHTRLPSQKMGATAKYVILVRSKIQLMPLTNSLPS